MAKRQIGGSFAPPLSDELLDKYQALIAQSQGAIKDTLTTLLTCCRKWWELPESVGGGNAHPSGRGFIVELDHAIKESLWDLIPWPHEIKAMESVISDCQAEAVAINAARLAAWRQAVANHAATHPESSSSIPRPVLEDTQLRDAAFHLLWHVKELDLDREPITTDKLA